MSVLVAYLHTDWVSASFMDSLMRVVKHERERGGPHLERWACRSGPLSIPQGRNQAVRELLSDESFEWLWFVDSDMGFRSDCLERLLEAADPLEAPVVGALCIGQFAGPSDGMGGTIRSHGATLYRWAKGPADRPALLGRVMDYPDDSMVQVDGTGAACLLIHRSALEQVGEKHGETWFDQVTYGGTKLGEDLSFCTRLVDCDIPIYVHTGIPTTHCKTVFLGQ